MSAHHLKCAYCPWSGYVEPKDGYATCGGCGHRYSVALDEGDLSQIAAYLYAENDKLRQENAMLREALRFYANKGYSFSDDYGYLARKALGEGK